VAWKAVAEVCVGVIVSAGTQPTDGKIKAPTWVERMWLVGLDIFDIQRVHPAVAFL
jgi:hypothetical protein